MKRRLEQRVLGPIYRAAVGLRYRYWSIRQPMLVGVRVLIVAEDAVLLVRHRGGRWPWSLPGGGVERHERVAEAAVREAREETGVAVQITHLLGVFDSFHHRTTNCITVFVAAPLNPPQLPRSLEIAEARYFPLGALPDGLEHGARRRIAEFQAGACGITGLWWDDERARGNRR